MVSKAVASLASIILVACVIAGVVCLVNRSGDSHDGDHGTNISTSSKAVASICSTTSYKDACVNSLENVGKNESATAKDYIIAAIQATIEEAKKSIKAAESVKTDGGKDPRDAMAVEDCKDLLEFAIEDLQAAFSFVGDSDLHTINDRLFDLRNWLSAVVSYQQTCLDQIGEPQYKDPMEHGLLNATQLTSNALTIVSQLGEILKAFHIDIELPKGADTGRRLMELSVVGHDDYPSWFPAGDRKLLQAGRAKPNAVVAQDGSGQYKTVGGAVNAIPRKSKNRWVIYIKAGVYRESVILPKDATNVYMYGDGPTKTIISGSKNFAINKITTMNTATFGTYLINGEGFIAKGIGFRNTAGPQGHQAVAFRSQSDLSAYFDCRFEGYQDTLYYQTNRQFYRNCVVSGTIDFIFGRGAAVIQNSEIIVRMPLPNQLNTVTADGTKEAFAISGVVLQNCKIVAEPQLFPNRFKIKSYLGRPWDKFSTTAVMESEVGDLIDPEGWTIWSGSNNHQTAKYLEYGNRGAGSNTNRRAKWTRVIKKNEALKYTPSVFLEGGKKAVKWVQGTGLPVTMGLTY
ncbi:pectinesterase 4-like [Diospyros lotus]|uniref:pectinesterase 4-like n=1 Tax=Diospyros lotus TaxID=55363 RepID=UPI0022574142|nr:pectinesterase 4-like [Diospyros lotus]